MALLARTLENAKRDVSLAPGASSRVGMLGIVGDPAILRARIEALGPGVNGSIEERAPPSGLQEPRGPAEDARQHEKDQRRRAFEHGLDRVVSESGAQMPLYRGLQEQKAVAVQPHPERPHSREGHGAGACRLAVPEGPCGEVEQPEAKPGDGEQDRDPTQHDFTSHARGHVGGHPFTV